MKKQLFIIILSFSLIFSFTFSTQGQAYANAVQQSEVVSGVNFRTQPYVSGQQIRMLRSGETVEILLSGENISKSAQPTPNVFSSKATQRVINAGMKYLGTPYQFGSNRNSKATFDCSDFVRRAYLDGTGLRLPADSRSQGSYVKNQGDISQDWSKLKSGDVMFFMAYKGTKASDYAGINKKTERITHNGIYLGNGNILHTYSQKSGGVRIDTISGSHWEKRFLFGGSPL